MDFAALLQAADVTVRDDLGDDVTYRPGAGAAVTVRGVFDAPYTRVDAGNAGVSASDPAVFLRLSELSSDPSDDADARITYAAVTYKVRAAEPDGLGGVRCFLQQVA